jgi:hypothetical protein
LLALPVLPPPTILTGEEPVVLKKLDIFYFYTESLKNFAVKLQASRIRTENVSPLNVARFIAKIAHSQACAVIGLNNFEPLLIDLILGNSDSFAPFVGSEKGDEFKSTHTHEIDFDLFESDIDLKKYIVGTVRLFANLGAPIYFAVVGEIKTQEPLGELHVRLVGSQRNANTKPVPSG